MLINGKRGEGSEIGKDEGGRKDEERRRKKRGVPACFFLGVASLTAAMLLLFSDPVSIVAQKYTQISPDSYVLEFLKKKLESMHLSLYIFNITNGEEFMSGKDYKLKVKEVGPFTYRESLFIENLTLDEEAGVMRYRSHFQSDFIAEESIGRPEDFNVTVPNFVMLGLTSAVSSYPYFVRVALDLLVRKQKPKPLITLDARSFLWGYPDPMIKLARKVVPALVTYDNIGFLQPFYNTTVKNELVVGATENDKFLIKTRNGLRKLMMSPLQDTEICDKCDTFENTYEGMMFPSPVAPGTPIRIFRNGLCKLVDLVYHGRTVLENSVEGLVYHINDSFFNNGRVNGLLDLSDCLHGFPVTLSKVHLLGVEPEVYERIEGIKPDLDKDNINYIVIEPITGVNIATYVTNQVNLHLGDLSVNSDTRKFSNMVLPVCYYIAKQPEMLEFIASVLKILYVTLPLILLFTRIILFLLAFTLLANSMRPFYCRKFSNSHGRSVKNLTNIDEKDNSVKVIEPLLTNEIPLHTQA